MTSYSPWTHAVRGWCRTAARVLRGVNVLTAARPAPPPCALRAPPTQQCEPRPTGMQAANCRLGGVASSAGLGSGACHHAAAETQRHGSERRRLAASNSNSIYLTSPLLARIKHQTAKLRLSGPRMALQPLFNSLRSCLSGGAAAALRMPLAAVARACHGRSHVERADRRGPSLASLALAHPAELPPNPKEYMHAPYSLPSSQSPLARCETGCMSGARHAGAIAWPQSADVSRVGGGEGGLLRPCHVSVAPQVPVHVPRLPVHPAAVAVQPHGACPQLCPPRGRHWLLHRQAASQ